MSSVNSSSGVTTTDSRNNSYFLTKKSGTSMASPQVAGIIACLAETWPRISQSQVISYIQTYAKYNQLTDTGGAANDYTSLQGSTNRFLYYVKERPIDGRVYPKVNQGVRPSSGMTYPRTKIYRYGQ